MSAVAERVGPEHLAPGREARVRGAGSAPDPVAAFAVGQGVNVRRHLEALRDFRRAEFGTGVARPSEGHVQAVNDLLARLRRPLESAVLEVEAAGRGRRDDVGDLLRLKSRAHDWVRATERVWDFYFELFGQRQGAFGDWLYACDKIALDCYQHVHMHLGRPLSIPSPGPFAYMRTGFSPATYRRNIPLRKLGRQLNPFPLVQLPYHRMVNPWTMGAVLHEVCHNLQNELGLQHEIPKAIHRAVLAAGAPAPVARTWAQWDREIFADLMGCMLGGEAFVASLMDVIGRSPEQVLAFSPHGVHPTPYLRTYLSSHLLRRMGFPEIARDYERLWRRLYPSTRGTTIPRAMLETRPAAVKAVVDAVCYTSFPSLGEKSLRQVITFEPRQQAMIEEAAGRLAKGTDPGVVPERFLIGAVRIAVDRRLAAPDVLMRNFYAALAGT
ncbi:hypothetical protein [Nocardioides sp. LS1]|uniref:hypothetical protein n=1 Tax=Nocardioides sp. LS1 TaxID=1027620 RepID=UPI000FF92120|nr:hypothetical protein [Nocardioides sp. LS1]GCD91834.1 hypothetical protein NLS1_38400 [Nocardioides sp. LS1]